MLSQGCRRTYLIRGDARPDRRRAPRPRRSPSWRSCSAPTRARSQLGRTYCDRKSHCSVDRSRGPKENGRNREARPSLNREASRLGDAGPEGPVPAAILVRYKNEYASSPLLPPFLIVGSCFAKTAGASGAAAGTVAAVETRHGADARSRRVETVKYSRHLWMTRCKSSDASVVLQCFPTLCQFA
jgi:hypothetical protein